MPFRNRLLPAAQHALHMHDKFLVTVTKSELQVFALSN